MKIFILITIGIFMSGISFSQATEDLLEPALKMKSYNNKKEPRVALTLDACGGETDWRILDGLVANNIAATLFVTEKWLVQNEKALEVIRSRPDLFQMENHGAQHIPPVDTPQLIYGIKSAGSLDAVEAEVVGGANALISKGFPAPKWYRGATALYTKSSIAKIHELGFKVAGFSVNGDQGASLKKEDAARRISAAKDGDVIISHMNQPKRESGEGVLKGVLSLKEKGYKFVRLRDEGISWKEE